jgi:hypothetical protein
MDKLKRLDMDNVNVRKNIRIIAQKVGTLIVGNNVTPIELHEDLYKLQGRHMTIKQHLIDILPAKLGVLDLAGTLDSELTLDIGKLPQLVRLFLEVKEKRFTIICKEPHTLERLKINENVQLNGIVFSKLVEINIMSSCIDQKMINNLPATLEDMSFYGSVIGEPVINVKRFPLLGIVRLFYGMDKHIKIKGNYNLAYDGLFIIK